jgi:hypothetical protein
MSIMETTHEREEIRQRVWVLHAWSMREEISKSKTL